MSNYTKTTDFAAKDSLPTGDAGKIIRGAEFGTEFDNIATAIATKADTAGPTLTGTTTFDTLSDGTIAVTAFVDEDDMSSDSATMLPTQQSVKAYVDSQATAQDLDFEADTGGPLSIDLDSETLTFTGGTGIDTSGVDNAVTFAIDNTVTTLTDTQTLTNKTLTSPDIDTPDIDGGTIDGTVIGGTTPAAVSATTVSATGNITVDGTVDGRDVATDGTKLDTVETNADVTDETNVTAAGALMDSEVTNLDQVKAFDSSDYATAAQGTTADNALPKTGGAMTGAITTNSTFDGRDVATDGTKLDGIEALADVTDTTNVTAAGALMDSELTDLTAVKSLDQGVATTDTPTFAGLATSANVTFGDNDKAIFGADSDLQIYHSGSHSIIDEAGTGDLYLRSTNGDAVLIYAGGTTSSKKRISANSTGEVELYYGSTARLATSSTGIDVTGTVTADGGTIVSTGSDAFSSKAVGGYAIQAYQDATSSGHTALDLRSDATTGTRYLIRGYKDAAGTPTEVFSVGADGTATMDGLVVDGTITSPPSIRISNDGSGGWAVGNETGRLQFYTTDASALGPREVASIRAVTNQGGTTTDGTLEFWTSPYNTVAKKSMEIDGVTGDISFYEDTGTTAKLFWDSSAESLGIGTSTPQASIHTTGDAIIGTTTSGASYEGVLQIADGAVNERTVVLIYNNHPDQFMKLGQDVNTAFIGRDQADEFAIGVFDNAADTTLSKQFVINDSGNVGIAETDPKGLLHVNGFDYSYFSSNVGSATLDNEQGLAVGWNKSAGGGETVLIANQGAGSSGGMAFATNTSAGSYDERMRIDSSGNLLVGTTDNTLVGRTDSGRVCIDNEDGYDCLQLKGSGVNHLNIASWIPISGGGYHIGFGDGTGSYTERGVISTDGSVTNYGGTSDYRLKENVIQLTGAINRVKMLSPSRFNFIDKPEQMMDGFIAHEVQAVVPEAVVGEKDALKEDGSIRPQQLDNSKLVPLLTAALQEALEKIDNLESRLLQLEGEN